jgi:chromosome segregation ATPase
MSSRKGEGQRAIQAPANDVPSLKAKVAETKVRIEELRATRETLDKERNKLTSRKEKLRAEIDRYVKMETKRSRLSLRTAPAQPSRSSTALAPSERPTPILSALFLLHSIANPDTPQ